MSPGDVRLTVTCGADGTLTCELAGELDASSGEVVLASVRAAAHERRPLTIVLDELRFCGVVGLRLLKDVGDIRAAAGATVLVVGASALTARLLRLMDLSPSVDLLRREDAAPDVDPRTGDRRDVESEPLATVPLA